MWCFDTIHLFYLFLAVFIPWRQLLRFVGDSEKERVNANKMNVLVERLVFLTRSQQNPVS